MRKTVLYATVMTLAFSAVVVPSAGAEETGWNIRLNGTWTTPEAESVNDGFPGFQLETDTGDTFGLALAFEYRFSKRVGLELGAQAGYDAGVNYTVRDQMTGGVVGDGLDPHPGDEMRFTVVDAALNIYLASGGVDFYVGPVVGFVSYEDTVVRLGSEDPPFVIENDGDIAFGGVVGLDIPFVDSPWFVTSSVKYLKTSYDASSALTPGEVEIDFDPWIVRLGLGFRF